MNNRKIVGIIIIIVGLIAIAGIIYMLFFNHPSTIPAITNIDSNSPNDTDITKDPVVSSNTKTPSRRIQANIADSSQKTKLVEKSQKEVSKDDLKRIAGSFVERFGSYSNQSNYSNIRDLKIFMSDKMRRWTDSFITEQRKKVADNNLYYGIITKTIIKEITDYDEDAGLVVIRVDTRRREAVGTSANFSDVFNQSIQVKFVKEKGVWKVDSADWQER